MPNQTIPLRKRSGQLRHRVELQEGVPTTDELGGRSMTFPAFGDEWAAIDSQPFVVSETQAAVLYQVHMRYREDLVTRFQTQNKQIRIVGAGKTLKVMALVNPEQRNRDLILHCGEVFN